MDYSELDGWIWLNGKWVEARSAKVHVLTHTFHYGTGVFEGIRAYKTSRGAAIFRLNEHTTRLFESARLIGMDPAFTYEEMIEAQVQILNKQGLTEGYIRPLLYFGSEGVGLGATELKSYALVAAWEWPSYLPKEALENGSRLITAKTRRPSGDSMIHRAKATGYYLNAVMARREAASAGVDEALMLDCDGNVAEGTGENIFLVKDGQMITPLPKYCLKGITRDTIIQLAADRGIVCHEMQFTTAVIHQADEVFLTGTAAEVTPVGELDGRTLGKGGMGPITRMLRDDYLSLVRGETEDKRGWLTYTNKDSQILSKSAQTG